MSQKSFQHDILSISSEDIQKKKKIIKPKKLLQKVQRRLNIQNSKINKNLQFRCTFSQNNPEVVDKSLFQQILLQDIQKKDAKGSSKKILQKNQVKNMARRSNLIDQVQKNIQNSESEIQEKKEQSVDDNIIQVDKESDIQKESNKKQRKRKRKTSSKNDSGSSFEMDKKENQKKISKNQTQDQKNISKKKIGCKKNENTEKQNIQQDTKKSKSKRKKRRQKKKQNEKNKDKDIIEIDKETYLREHNLCAYKPGEEEEQTISQVIQKKLENKDDSSQDKDDILIKDFLSWQYKLSKTKIEKLYKLSKNDWDKVQTYLEENYDQNK